MIEVSGINNEFLNGSLLRLEQRGEASLVIDIVSCDAVAMPLLITRNLSSCSVGTSRFSVKGRM